MKEKYTIEIDYDSEDDSLTLTSPDSDLSFPLFQLLQTMPNKLISAFPGKLILDISKIAKEKIDVKTLLKIGEMQMAYEIARTKYEDLVESTRRELKGIEERFSRGME